MEVFESRHLHRLRPFLYCARPISQALLARREAIQQELITAQQERERALAHVAEADSLSEPLDEDVRAVQRTRPTKKRTSERQRLAASTEREIEKLKQQAQREIETADKLARKELRQFLAERSVELARESSADSNETRRRHGVDSGEHW